MKHVTDINVIKACVLGVAVGDALGVPYEFGTREARDADPAADMRGHGMYDMPAGSWSDDTSMALCALDALGDDVFSWDTVMKNFGRWIFNDEYTPTGRTFDSGITCRSAIDAYVNRGKDPDHCGMSGDRDNGNGSLMRIIPFSLYAPDDFPFIEKASALTHAHIRSKTACGIYTIILAEILKDGSKNAVRRGILKAKEYYGDKREWRRNFEPLTDIGNRSRDSIGSGGYVVDTLEAALWCLLNTDSYKECVLAAVNLGRDTDTTAAVAGGLAGAMYGLEGIPQKWLDTLLKRDYIEKLCERAADRWARG